ncbi:transglycosylase domain-containing protein [Salininema proteolyticum]|uniref:transglycosylase domain-containing protein n=1 Tax=Salininema proteolyticum TaxID=1607685 RepID=UPI00363C72E8
MSVGGGGGVPPRGPSSGSASVSPSGSGPGRASVTGKRTGALSEDDLKDKKKKKRSKTRKRVYAVLIAVMVMFLGAGTFVGAMFFQEIQTPDDTPFGENTTFLYADGESEMAGYGYRFRELIDSTDDLPETVRWSTVASEDMKFYEHDGVDIKRTMGAFINNLTGGDQQGASTISQQYAGALAKFRDDKSYTRKAKEAVMAIKLEQEFSKDEILRHYLNLSYFGRGAVGVGAASKAYFNKPVDELSWGEAAFIIMQVKSPNGAYDPVLKGEEVEQAATDRWEYVMGNLWTMHEQNGMTKEDYDAAMDEGLPQAVDADLRAPSWGGDKATGFITNEIDGYIYEELEEHYDLSKDDLYGEKPETGGYTIVTTIDKEIQALTEETASRGPLEKQKNDDGDWIDGEGNVVDSEADAAVKYFKNEKVTDDEGKAVAMPRHKNDNEKAALVDRNPSMTDAVVVVEPGTGRVLGYYGGDDGFGYDNAGPTAAKPPSSTFKMATVATAISEQSSLKSWWDGSSPREFVGRGKDDGDASTPESQNGDPVHNAGNKDAGDVQLQTALEDSLNTPMFAIADHFGATKILKTAAEMGVENMTRPVNAAWEDSTFNAVFELRVKGETVEYAMRGQGQYESGEWAVDERENIDDMAYLRWANEDNSNEGVYASDDNEPVWYPLTNDTGRFPFDREISFGQYGVSVQDLSAMFATIANNGVYNETRYVEKVYDRDGNELEPKKPYDQRQAIKEEVARDLQFAGAKIDAAAGQEGQVTHQFFGKTGTWEAAKQFGGTANAHALYAGAIKQMSIAAWVGNAGADTFPLLNEDGAIMDGSYGYTLSGPVWNDLMQKIIKSKKLEDVGWDGPANFGKDTTFDIEGDDGKLSADSPYCKSHKNDPKCEQEEKDKDKDDEDSSECSAFDEAIGLCGNEDEDGENGGENGGEDGNGDESHPPGEGGEGGEDCNPFLEDCEGTNGEGGQDQNSSAGTTESATRNPRQQIELTS